MASTRTISWTLPTVGARQRPLSTTKIEFRAKVTSGTPNPWSLQDTVAASAAQQQLVIQNPPVGTFEYQLTWTDIDGRSSDPLLAEKTGAFDKPGQGTNVQIVDA